MSASLFRQRIRRSLADENLQIALDANAQRRKVGRLQAFASVPDHQERRLRAHAVKADIISHLDIYLDRFISRVTANGIQVHRATTAEEAVRIFLGIARDHNAHLVAKSKSMVSEEINFNHALATAGIEVVETDLGEYIVQLRGEPPSHILTPAVHLRRGQVGSLFHEKLGTPLTEDIQDMVETARRILREVFLTADIGVSGVNFGVVETGTLCLVTNEGNGRMVTSLPPVHVALMGIERLVPTLDDLSLFLSLLPRSATGQKLSSYTSLIHSPKRPTEEIGPNERHLILVDNGRIAISNSPLAESLFCVRCGACLNACPVFREIGGHAYVGQDASIAPYPGPIGSVISPGMLNCDNFGQLAQASSLCGACREVCPVDINLPEMLLRVRAGVVSRKAKDRQPAEGIALPRLLKLGLWMYRLAAGSPGLFSLGQRLGSLLSRVFSPGRDYMRIPGWTGWGYSKDFPKLAAQPFRAHWKRMNQNVDQVDRKTTSLPEPAQTTSPEVRSLDDRFTEELIDLGGKVYRMTGQQVPARLEEFLKARGIDRVCASADCASYLGEVPFTLAPDPTVRAGITSVLAGIADSGSLVLVNGAGQPLTTSLLPEIHIAVLRTSQLVPTLSDILDSPEIRSASTSVIITGPSRTADIEMTLSIGVHGPKELHVFLING